MLEMLGEVCHRHGGRCWAGIEETRLRNDAGRQPPMSRCTQIPEFALEGSFTALKCSNLASFCTQTPDRKLMNPKEIA
jgi:hypothetical protein